jgi:hypothetical protein
MGTVWSLARRSEIKAEGFQWSCFSGGSDEYVRRSGKYTITKNYLEKKVFI